jgi:SPP1 family predicted phage head-tail adaptor
MTLNELVSFYRLSQTQDAYGTLVTTRVLIAQAYAKVRPMSGGERNRSDQTEAFADYRFYIHYRSDIGAANLIVWNGTDYNIKFIADVGPKEAYMYIDAERGGAF